MPIVTIKIARGRAIELKRDLATAVTTAVSTTLAIPPQVVTVLIEEFERENWASGGELHIDKFGPGYGERSS